MNLIKKSSFPILDTMFSDMFENDYFSNRFLSNFPAVNIIENGKEYKIEFAAPGLKKEDFKITVDDKMLNVSAEKEDLKKNESETYTRREYNYNSFSRSFSLPEEIKEEDIDAKYEDGILKLSLPFKNAELKKSLKKEIKVK